MNNITHVILTSKVYESVLNYLSTTQTYNNVAQLIHDLVTDSNSNFKAFSVSSKAGSSTAPEVKNPNLDVLKDNE